MRDDMAKVIVEPPRCGGHGAGKGGASRDPDLLPENKRLRPATVDVSGGLFQAAA